MNNPHESAFLSEDNGAALYCNSCGNQCRSNEAHRCPEVPEEYAPAVDDQPLPAVADWRHVTECLPFVPGGGCHWEFIDRQKVLFSRPVLVNFRNTWAELDPVQFVKMARLRLDTVNPYLDPPGCSPEHDAARALPFWFGAWCLDPDMQELEGAGWRVTHWAELPSGPNE